MENYESPLLEPDYNDADIQQINDNYHSFKKLYEILIQSFKITSDSNEIKSNM